jgi:hypothetical protein
LITPLEVRGTKRRFLIETSNGVKLFFLKEKFGYECILEFLRDEVDNYDHAIVLTFDKEHFDNAEIREELTDIGVDLVFTAGDCIAMVHYALGI